MRIERFTLEFVETMPTELSEGTLYISMVYAVARHLCACGCGEEVVTMFTPIDWKLTFDGEHVSLQPSIGNWSFACRSHYWITDNRVRWARNMSAYEIARGRKGDIRTKAAYFAEPQSEDQTEGPMSEAPQHLKSTGTQWPPYGDV
jgi:hypothetical protein